MKRRSSCVNLTLTLLSTVTSQQDLTLSRCEVVPSQCGLHLEAVVMKVQQ